MQIGLRSLGRSEGVAVWRPPLVASILHPVWKGLELSENGVAV
jgi:hypothetical protein